MIVYETIKDFSAKSFAEFALADETATGRWSRRPPAPLLGAGARLLLLLS